MQKEVDIKETIEKYADLVYRIALTRSGTIENAEDIFQEVFIKYSQKSPKFENEEHKKAWIIRVTINISKNIHNQAWNKKVINLNENLSFETQEENEIFSIVCELPDNYKTVIYLFYYEGYKVSEIAKILKKREGTIKTWLSRGRQTLKNKIEGGFEDEQ
jgi:RNA polymerase sigma-70 factor (ECF subfamily)